MTILEAVRLRTLRLPRIRIPKWPRLNPGRAIADAAQAYADAVAIPYRIAFGLEPHRTATSTQKRQTFDD
jgi:hypothetical protein